MPRVSVVIPLFNKQAQIGRALASVLEQTAQDIELIVVDDGSTDGGPMLVEAAGDPRVRLIRQTNAGPGAARNRAVREASAEWIAPLDADDEWKPTFLERTLAWAAAAPDCDAIASMWHVAENDEGDAARRYARMNLPHGPHRLDPSIDAVGMHRLVTRLGNRNVLLRRAAVLACGGYYEKSRHGEDVYLFVQMLLHGPVYLGDEVLARRDTDASELSIGRRKRGLFPPPRPVVADPDPIRADCPPAHRPALERWLEALAAAEFARQVRAGRADEARRVRAMHPSIERGMLDRWRNAWWLRQAERNAGRHLGEWPPLPRAVHKTLRFMRPRTLKID